MDDELFRHHLRNHFLSQIKNPKLQQKNRHNYSTESPAQHIKEQALKAQPKIHEFETNLNVKERNLNSVPNSGGDADRMLCNPQYIAHNSGDSHRLRDMNDNYGLKQSQTKHKPSAPSLNSNISRKYQTTSAVNECIGDHRCLSNLCDIGNGTEDSAKSQKSSKTVVSLKSSQDLRKFITSECKLNKVIDETLKQMCTTEADTTVENNACGLSEQTSTQYPSTQSQCKHCTERMQIVQSQKDVMTEIGKEDFIDYRNTDTLTISLDDVLNSKVINPMIRKLQRMYWNNLKDEMSLMEDLERMPYKVSEVYKAEIFKKND